MTLILHPTDFTSESEQAFRLACSIARDQFAELIGLHVISADECPEDDRCGDEPHFRSSVYMNHRDNFEKLRSMAGDLPVLFQIKIGMPVDAIVDFALQTACDLIVVAAQYHDSLVYRIHSSVSTCLVSQAHCPVVCLNEPHKWQTRRKVERFEHRFRE